MTTTYSSLTNVTHGAPIQERVDSAVEDLISSLPDPETLTAEQRRGIIARPLGAVPVMQTGAGQATGQSRQQPGYGQRRPPACANGV